MRNVALATLEDRIVRPGIEAHLRPLLMYRGNLSLGRIHRLWNLMVSGMEHEATCSDITQRLILSDQYSQLCVPNRAVVAVTVASFASRLMDNPKVTDLMPGLRDYADWVIPRYKRIGPLERVSEITHRSRHIGAGGWRIFVDDRAPEPVPDGFALAARGKTIRWAREEYGRSYFIVRRWFQEIGLAPVHGSLLPLPDRWGEFATREGNGKLALRFGVSGYVVARWREESGLRYIPIYEAKAPALVYPFLIHDAGKPEHALLRQVNAAIPSGLAPELRADMCQDLIVGILAGDYSRDDLSLPGRETVKRVMKLSPSRYGELSLDAMIGDGDFSLMDTLADEGRDWA